MWWTLVGVVLEAVGLGVTGWGIYKTWVGSGTDERFLDPAVEWPRHAIHQTHGWFRRVLHLRGRDHQVFATEAAGAVDAVVTVTGDGAVSFTPLDPALPTADALALLDDRVRGLLWMTDQNRRADLVKVQAVEAQAADTAAALVKVRADLSAAKLDLAVHGLRTEAGGLALVGLGLLLQLVGQLVA